MGAPPNRPYNYRGMRTLLRVLLLATVAAADSAEVESAADVLQEAIRAQGAFRRDELKDIRLHFNGQVVEEGEHAVEQTFWYRASDRSFRLRTQSQASPKAGSDYGALGEKGYWERSSRGSVFTLSATNREDRKSVRSIRRKRRDFERILRMVLLARLNDGETKVTFAKPRRTTITKDLPYEANAILGRGRERERRTYDVLDLKRKDAPRVRLFVRTDDRTVAKAVQYRANDPERPEWFYYFGPFVKDEDSALVLPRYFSAHKGRPADGATKKSTCKFRGEISVTVNQGLGDAELKPKTP